MTVLYMHWNGGDGWYWGELEVKDHPDPSEVAQAWLNMDYCGPFEDEEECIERMRSDSDRSVR